MDEPIVRSHGRRCGRQHTGLANLIRLSLHLKDVRLEFVIVLYPSLWLEESTFFVREIVQTFVQSDLEALPS